MKDSDAAILSISPTRRDSERTGYPTEFATAVESMHSVTLRPELVLATIRPPQRLAPYSHAIGIEKVAPDLDDASIPTESEGDAFGRLIALYDPRSDDTWSSQLRLVAYIQADMDAPLANDPLLPEVAWQWLNEGLELVNGQVAEVGGTVTSTSSVRFGDIGGTERTFQMEMRASWTALDYNLSPHVQAFAHVLANVAGLPPEGVSVL